MFKRFSIIMAIAVVSVILFFNNVCATSLSPYGKLEWSDNVIDIFRKLKEIKTIKEIHIEGPDSFDRVNGVEKSEEDLKVGIKDFVAKGSKGWMFDEMNKEVVLKDARKSLYHIRNIKLWARPIILVGIPYKISFQFEQVPGYVLTNPDKCIRTDVNGKEILFLAQFNIINLTPLDNRLAEEHYQKLFDIIRKKYPVMKDMFGDEWNGKSHYNMTFYARDGDYAVGFLPRKEGPEIKYTNWFKSVKKMYNDHRNKILWEENKDSDSSSGL